MKYMEYNSKEEFTEFLAYTIIKGIYTNTVINNTEEVTAVDIIVNNNVKIDVQYSTDFKKYGDFRLDFISMFDFVDGSQRIRSLDLNSRTEQAMFEEFERKTNVKIIKKGKFFLTDNYLDGVIVFFYNEKLPSKIVVPENKDEIIMEKVAPNLIPDFTFLVKRVPLINYLKNNKENIRVIINDKTRHGLDDEHESAFIPLKMEKLIKTLNKDDFLLTSRLPKDHHIKTFFKTI